MARLTISIRDWVAQKVIATSKGNKSARIEELIIKGIMSEMEEINAVCQFLTGNSSLIRLSI